MTAPTPDARQVERMKTASALELLHKILTERQLLILERDVQYVEKFVSKREAQAAAEALEEAYDWVDDHRSQCHNAMVRAKTDGRDGVAMCRQTDVETCERVMNWLRAEAAKRRG